MTCTKLDLSEEGCAKSLASLFPVVKIKRENHCKVLGTVPDT